MGVDFWQFKDAKFESICEEWVIVFESLQFFSEIDKITSVETEGFEK